MRATPFVTLVLACACVEQAHAQGQPQRPIWLVAKADTVFVYLTRTLANGGFVVYRAPVPGTAAQRVQRTADPIVRVREPTVAAGQLGSDLPMVMRATRAADEIEMLRRLNNDRFAADMLTALSRNVATVLGRLYVDAGVSRGAEYEYRVVLTDRTGRETDSAFTARVRVADITPVAPTGFRARIGDSEARLTWNYPPYRGDPRDLIIGFHVYRAEGSGGNWQRLTITPVVRDDANAPEFVDSEVRNGSSVRYQVTAADITGRESAPLASPVSTVQDRTPPAMPSNVIVQEGEGTISVSWRLAPEPDAAGYHIERATGVADRFERLNRALIPVQRPEWVDSVAGARRFFYRVLVVDAAGNAGDPSNPLSAIAKDKTPPAAPTNVVAKASGRRVTVRWNASTARDLRGYNVYRGDTPEHAVRLVDAPVVATQFVDSGYSHRGLRPGRNYVVEVTAVDSAFNESPRTRATVSIADDEAPTAPTAFSARNVLGRHVELNWSASTALDVAAYELSRSTIGGTGSDTTVRLGRFQSRAHTIRDTTVVRTRRYVYRLVAFDTAGNRGGIATDTVEFRGFIPPPPPRVAAARLTPTGVVVTWQRVIASELAGYHVYRSLVPTGVFERVTAVPVRELTVTDRTGKAEHFYMVRAVDRSGNESDKSPVAGVIRP